MVIKIPQPLTGKCRTKLGKFLIGMFADKPEGVLGIEFVYNNEMHRFLIKKEVEAK